MTKIAFITDTHHGARGSSKVFRDMMRAYYKDEFFPHIKKNEIKTILHLGDFFDSRNSISLHDIDYTMNEWLPQLEASGATMYVIAGNHDVAYRNTNKINSLSLLKASKHVVVIDSEVQVLEFFDDGPKFVMCPWVNSENHDELVEDLKTYATKDHILCMHTSFEGMKMYKNSIVCDHGFKPELFKNYLRVFSGHFHHPSVYGNIEYMGALFHFNWQDYNDWRGFMVYDNDAQAFTKIENTNCLFHQVNYHDALTYDKEELAILSGKILRLTINQTYDKVELKDLVNTIESYGPVSVDVIDNTIIERVVMADDEPDDVKELHEYVNDALQDDPLKKELTDLFDVVYNESIEKMKEVE